VIDAPEATLFVAAVKERSPAMPTVLVQKADPSLCITKSDEFLAEKSYAHGRTVGIGNFLRQQSGNPISPQ
jgi:hypothetical protein